MKALEALEVDSFKTILAGLGPGVPRVEEGGPEEALLKEGEAACCSRRPSCRLSKLSICF